MNKPRRFGEGAKRSAISEGGEQIELQEGKILIEVEKSAEAAADFLVSVFIDRVKKANKDANKKQFVVALPTGGTPKQFYKHLAERVKKEGIDLSKLAVVRIEGFVGIDRQHEFSFDGYMEKQFFNACGLEATSENFLSIEDCIDNPEDKTEEELNAAAKEYDQRIKVMGGIDFAFLGLGGDAHIGDVQPSKDMSSAKGVLKARSTRTMRIPEDFDPYTQEVFDNHYSQDGAYPSETFISLGLTPLVQAKELFVMATGPSKKDAVQKGVFDAVSRLNRTLGTPGASKEQLPDELLSPLGFLLTAAPETKLVLDQEAYNDLVPQIT